MQCQHRWQKVLNPELIKGPWTKEEDQRVSSFSIVICITIKNIPQMSLLNVSQLEETGRVCKQKAGDSIPIFSVNESRFLEIF